MSVKKTPGRTTAGSRTFQETVWPNSVVDQAGMMRSAPSRKPTYQSGCEPAEIWSGSYGPYSHTGLTWRKAAIPARTPKTMRK